MGHDHGLPFELDLGPAWLWLPLLAGVLPVISAALLRPVLPAAVVRARSAVTGLGAAVLLLVLLTGGELALPRQAVAATVLGAFLAVVAGRLSRAGHTPWPAKAATRLAPLVVLGTTAGAAVLLLTAVLGPAADAQPAVRAGLLIGLLGLTWLGLARPRARTVRLGVHGTGWLLANLVLGATTAGALTALP